jgi:transposase
MIDRNEPFDHELYKVDDKPKQTYSPYITEEMAIRYLQTLGYPIPDMANTT